MACFGSKSHVWLFGSRVNDHQKGGDIDLYIEPELQGYDLLVNAKWNWLNNSVKSELRHYIEKEVVPIIVRAWNEREGRT